MTGVSLGFEIGPIPVRKAKDWEASVRGGCTQNDDIDWIKHIEMHIFINKFGTLLTICYRENSLIVSLEAACSSDVASGFSGINLTIISPKPSNWGCSNSGQYTYRLRLED